MWRGVSRYLQLVIAFDFCGLLEFVCMLGFAPCCKSDLAILHNPPLAVACRAVSPYAFTTSIELTCSWLRCIKRFSTRWDAAFSELLTEKTWSKVFLSESQAYKTINLHNGALSVKSNEQILNTYQESTISVCIFTYRVWIGSSRHKLRGKEVRMNWCILLAVKWSKRLQIF